MSCSSSNAVKLVNTETTAITTHVGHSNKHNAHTMHIQRNAQRAIDLQQRKTHTGAYKHLTSTTQLSIEWLRT
eukprot:m.359719 g.359719  ORF g.359719 m.359719 type:complete len:73 (-) comp18691_c0_seq1:1303-1521(-)